MSRIVTLTVTCDGWHLNPPPQATVKAADIEAARKALRRDGWRFRAGAVTCPTCTRALRPRATR